MTGQYISSHLRLICSEYEWPDILVSDNGACYASDIFTNLMAESNVNHIPSSPHYPQSNGLAEKYVQIFKNLFHKAQEEDKDLYQCLMVYHNTPLSSILQSPIQIITNRAARSSLPMCKCSKETKRSRMQGIENSLQEWTLTHTWPSHRSECHVLESCWQKMVSSHNYKPLSRALKL